MTHLSSHSSRLGTETSIYSFHLPDIKPYNIDTVWFRPGESILVIDNITYSSIPLPPSVLLLGSGLLCLVGWRRSKKS